MIFVYLCLAFEYFPLAWSISQWLSSLSAFLQSDAYQATGCYNLLCSGFIQVNSEIAMGASISPISGYRTSQYDISILIWKVKSNPTAEISNASWILFFPLKLVMYECIQCIIKNIFVTVILRIFCHCLFAHHMDPPSLPYYFDWSRGNTVTVYISTETLKKQWTGQTYHCTALNKFCFCPVG